MAEQYVEAQLQQGLESGRPAAGGVEQAAVPAEAGAAAAVQPATGGMVSRLVASGLGSMRRLRQSLSSRPKGAAGELV